VEATIKTVQQLLAEEAHLSPALRSILEVLIILKTAVEYIPANKNQHKLDKENCVM
jgi:hypothetical protein